MNKACLLKLGWKLDNSIEEYWCSVLSGKYDGRWESVNGGGRASDSSLWRALNELKPILDKHSCWSVGDGRDINAWNDVWIEEGLCLQDQFYIPQHLNDMKVADLVTDDGQWNWSLLGSWIPSNLCQKIAAIYPPHMDNGRDERIGAGGSKNDFSIAVMYNTMCGFREEDVDPIWRRIWKIKVLERVRTFIWMVKHTRLLTNSLKSVMGLCHAMCSYCGDVEETTLHAMRDCPVAKDMLLQLILNECRGLFFMGELDAWIEYNLQNQNKELHDEEFVRPMRPVLHVLKLLKDYAQAMQNHVNGDIRGSIVALIGWVPPKENFVKLNTDGASKNNQVAGCGGVVRGTQSEWVGGFAMCVGRSRALVAEAWGVLEGLQYVWRAHNAGVGMLMKHIWELLDREWEVEV
ncbi:hypothetical protein TSUD_403390 [Trifolium subterraneum]|uniref:Reverse transcriptase zinc-binding domain-containing protein n=1 Tax=Trifolium subterraneum TaxID=3900 RepID=A0A2Z6NUB1_TRISU|nr:hypothetical protein TSUD_403390 [Trifolium subterraneum]